MQAKQIQTQRNHTPTFYQLSASKKRFFVAQGGTRSGKTYAILAFIIRLCKRRKNEGLVISIIRKTMPALSGSAMRDFLQILKNYGAYEEGKHNKSTHTYELWGNLIEFVSIDQPQKTRGRQRDIAFLNEANELTFEDFMQINLRTKQRVIIDYNPSMEFWVQEIIADEATCDFFVTTYRDNQFLPEAQVREIERLEATNPTAWQVYGQGRFAPLEGQIFRNWQVCDEFPSDCEKVGYGLDFGYSPDPTALIRCGVRHGEIYLDEVVFERELNGYDLIERMKGGNVSRMSRIICDVDKSRIAELQRAGWRGAEAAVKGPNSIEFGIDVLRRYKINVTSRSANLINEFKKYAYKLDSHGKSTGIPIEVFNHGIDAARYWAMAFLSSAHQRVRGGGYAVFG